MENINVNVTKKDRYNGMNSAGKAEEYLDIPLTLNGMFTFSDEVADKETGEVKEQTLICLITDKATIASPSKTLVDSAIKLYKEFGEDEIVGLEIKITPSRSNNGRTFYRLELV